MLRIEQLTALCDTRERGQTWDLAPMRMERASLVTGDFTIRGLETVAALERKSLSDLVACCVGDNRKRFQRQLDRLRAFPVNAVIVEASWETIESGAFRSNVHPNSVLGSIAAWQARGNNIVLAGSRDMAQRVARSMLWTCAKDVYRTGEALRGHIGEDVAK